MVNNKRRCDDARIGSDKWNSKRPSFGARMIFITTESVVTKGFARFMETWKMAGGTDRIVVDEGHMVSDGSERWRPKMVELIKMMNKRVQVIF